MEGGGWACAREDRGCELRDDGHEVNSDYHCCVALPSVQLIQP